jgi:hypothetical protein
MDNLVNHRSDNQLSGNFFRRLGKGLLLLLVVGLCVANLLLVKQNRELKALVSQISLNS